MNTYFAIVDPLGEVVRLVAGEPDQVLLNVGPYEEVIFDPWPGDSWWDFKTQSWVPKPAPPGPHHSWDPATKSWVDPRPIEDVRASRWEAIKKARDQAEVSSTFECDGAVYRSDPVRIGGAAQGAQIALTAGLPFSMSWTLQDNTTKVLDAPGMIRVGLAQLAHIDAIHQYSRTLRDRIFNQAKTNEEVEAISWNFQGTQQ